MLTWNQCLSGRQFKKLGSTSLVSCRRGLAIIPRHRLHVSAQKKDTPRGGFGFERTGGAYRVSMNGSELLIPEQTVMLSGLALLGLGAVIGPIVIGLAITALSIGFTLSVGALALSTMFIPMLLLSIITFGFFSSFAMLGVGIFAPSLLPLVVTGAGLAIGWTLVRMFVPKDIEQRAQSSSQASDKAKQDSKSAIIDIDPSEAEARRLAKELKDFDELLATRDYEKRMDQWRKGGR